MPRPVSPPPAPTETSPPHHHPSDPVLTDLQADLLDAIRRAKRPRKGVLLAKDCDRPFNTKTRDALSALCQLGLAHRIEGGGYEAGGGGVVA